MFKIIILNCLVGWLCLVSPLSLAASNQLKQTDNKLQNVLVKIKQLKNDLLHAQTSEQRTNSKLKHIDTAVATSANQLVCTQKKLAAQQKRLFSLRQKQAKLHTELINQHTALAEQLRHIYQLKKHDPVKLLLNQTQVTDVSRTLAYYRYFNQARLQLIKQMRDTLTALHNNEKSIQSQTKVLTKLKQQQLTEKSNLDKQHREQQHLLTHIHSQLLNKNQQLSRLDADKKALTQLIKKLHLENKRDNQYSYFKQHRGKLPLPTAGKIATHFNDSVSSQHNLALRGMIIRAPTGQAVTAIAPGKVVFADWLRGMGLLLIIDHGDGYLTLYGHNQSLAKHVGDHIKQGELIASVGQSGGQISPGLYFAIRHKGIAIDPAKWCQLHPNFV